MPKISVIIPVYNVEKYIEECLESVSKQTFSDIEIICVDDCGQDNSIKIVEEYQKKDNRIKIITHNKNKGLAASRNTGMAQASGDYISYIDSDDYIETNFLEELYKKAIETNADIVQSSIIFYYEDNNNFAFYVLNKDMEDFDIITQGKTDIYYNAGMCWNKLYKATLIKEHNITFPEGLYWEDNPFVIRAAHFANDIQYTKNTNYIYRQRKGSIVKLGNKKLHFDLLTTHIDMANFINSIDISKVEYINIFSRFMNRIMWEYDKIEDNPNLKNEKNNFKKEWKKVFKLCKYKKEVTKKVLRAYKIMVIPHYLRTGFNLIVTSISIIPLVIKILFKMLFYSHRLLIGK